MPSFLFFFFFLSLMPFPSTTTIAGLVLAALPAGTVPGGGGRTGGGALEPADGWGTGVGKSKPSRSVASLSLSLGLLARLFPLAAATVLEKTSIALVGVKAPALLEALVRDVAAATTPCPKPASMLSRLLRGVLPRNFLLDLFSDASAALLCLLISFSKCFSTNLWVGFSGCFPFLSNCFAASLFFAGLSARPCRLLFASASSLGGLGERFFWATFLLSASFVFVTFFSTFFAGLGATFGLAPGP